MISIIIPTYNRSCMLREAIESVLQQRDIETEIIVVDDNSTDNTLEVMKKYPQIIYLKNNVNKGPGYSRLFGYTCSKGEYIVFMDDDDYYIVNTFFCDAVKILDCDLSLSLVAGNSFIKKEPQQALEESPMNISGFISGLKYLNGFQFKYSKPHSTFNAVLRKSSLEKAELRNMKMVNDASIYMRALTVGNIYLFDENIGVYRVHSNNISKSLDYKFLIANLIEKESIFYIIKEKLKYPQLWWFQQFRLIYNYFLWTNPSIEDKKSLIKWGKIHFNESYLLYIYLLFKAIQLK